MYPYTVTPKIHASCISGEKAGCSRQHGKIYSTTSRKYFESVSSQSRLEIMQQVSDNCQSAQRCRKPIMPCSGTSLTHGMSSYSSSYKQTPHRKSQHVPLTTSWLNSPNVSRIGVCNHRNRCKTKNKIIVPFQNIITQTYIWQISIFIDRNTYFLAISSSSKCKKLSPVNPGIAGFRFISNSGS